MDIEKELSDVKKFSEVYSPVTHSRNEWELFMIQLVSLENSVKIIKDYLAKKNNQSIKLI